MLLLGVLIGVFGKINFVSPANSDLFEGLDDSIKKKLCKKFCVVPLICGVVLVVFYFVGAALELPKNAYLIPLGALLALTMYDFSRTSKVIAKLRSHTFNEDLDL